MSSSSAMEMPPITKKISKRCPHGKSKNGHFCKDCGGKGLCEHNKRKDSCKDCGGSRICEHGISKYVCFSCDGKGLCSHGAQKNQCKECHPEKSKIHQFWNSPEGLARIAEKSAAEQESLVRLRANLAASLARANW
jgi:hypothetical protein